MRRGATREWLPACMPALQLRPPRHGSAQVRDHDGAADDEGNGESLEDLAARDALLSAADEMIGDTVVAAEYH